MRTLLAVTALLALLALPARAEAPPLPGLGIDPATITVSGVSSGAFMAHQFHVAHAATIAGAGLIAGGPFECAGTGFPGTMARALSVCASMGRFAPFVGPPDLDRLRAAIAAHAAAGQIDDPAGLAGDRVYLFSGSHDHVVPTPVVEAVADLYRSWISGDGLILDTGRPVPHGMIVADGGNPCDSQEPPFLNDCDFDLAGMILRHLYGSLPEPPRDRQGQPVSFDQGAFAEASAALLPAGVIYIPARCRQGGCRLHVAFHGCLQNTDQVGDAFVTRAGYNRWADAGGIVVLYPQAAAVDSAVAGQAMPWPNPNGCWDWWGFTGEPYATRTSPQIHAVAAMIERLREPVSGARP